MHEDDALLVALKPAGLATQAPREFDSLERRIRAMLERRAAAKTRAAENLPTSKTIDAQPVYLGLPHRLDRAVSGVIVLAKTRRAARKLSRQFERREVQKIYWVGVAGSVDPPTGTWTDSMRKVPDEPRAEIVAEEHPHAQIAVLRYRTLGETKNHTGATGFVSAVSAATTSNDIQPTLAQPVATPASVSTLLEIELETGRMHQIRLQAATRGYPVWGDELYGSQIPFGLQTADPRQRIIAVHARSLGFKHPESGEPLTILAPLPAEWSNLGLPTDVISAERLTSAQISPR